MYAQEGDSSDASAASLQDRPQATAEAAASRRPTAKELFPAPTAARRQQGPHNGDDQPAAAAEPCVPADIAVEHAQPADILHAASPPRAVAMSVDDEGADFCCMGGTQVTLPSTHVWGCTSAQNM